MMTTGLEGLLEKLGWGGREDDHDLRTLLTTGAAAALPMAGLIGQQHMLNPDEIPEAGSMRKALRKLRKGDVVLTGDLPHSSAFKELTSPKSQIALATGTPGGYHAAVVMHGGGQKGKIKKVQLQHSHPVEGVGLVRGKDELKGRFTVMRPDLSRRKMKEYLENLKVDLNMRDKIVDMRKGSPKLRKAIPSKHWAPAGLYDESKAVRAGWKELFFPKLRSDTAIEENKRIIRSERKKFNPKSYLKAVAADYDMPHTELTTHLPNKCIGTYCSAMPAAALPKGHTVVPGKLVNDVMPSDYLRSKSFKPVTSWNPQKYTTYEKLLRHSPMLLRLIAGGLLAGTTYGANKVYDAATG